MIMVISLLVKKRLQILRDEIMESSQMKYLKKFGF
jgi:hypothetical protein